VGVSIIRLRIAAHARDPITTHRCCSRIKSANKRDEDRGLRTEDRVPSSEDQVKWQACKSRWVAGKSIARLLVRVNWQAWQRLAYGPQIGRHSGTDLLLLSTALNYVRHGSEPKKDCQIQPWQKGEDIWILHTIFSADKVSMSLSFLGLTKSFAWFFGTLLPGCHWQADKRPLTPFCIFSTNDSVFPCLWDWQIIMQMSVYVKNAPWMPESNRKT